MNRDSWQLYKESARGRKCIATFNPEPEDLAEAVREVITFSHKHDARPFTEEEMEYAIDRYALISNNFLERELASSLEDKESFVRLMEDFDLLSEKIGDDGRVVMTDDGRAVYDEGNCIVKKTDYRRKSFCIPALSLFLYYNYVTFKPILFQSRFDIIQTHCEKLGIEMPQMPRTSDYKAYFGYYFDICDSWCDFQEEYGLSDAELCACIYDYAATLVDDAPEGELPRPTNVWLTGASGGDFEILDSFGTDGGASGSVWACSEKTLRGDVVIVYCTSPRSYIHSVCRSRCGGIFNPFDYYHCRTEICDAVRIPPVTFKDLKADGYFATVPIVRKNLQGVNGVQLTPEDYAQLLRLIEQKGGDTAALPRLFDGSAVDFGEISLERDVEENILIPILLRLGYTEDDWTRQLSLKAGRAEKAIPDFAFFPFGERHHEHAPMVIEAKLDMSSARERHKAYDQARSYAGMLHAPLMGICDKERLVLYAATRSGGFDEKNPAFEAQWAAVFVDELVGAKLQQLIGREAVGSMARRMKQQ